MLAQEIIRIKRDGGCLQRAHIDAFVAGLVDGSWSEGQAAAMAMAMFLQGMASDETVAFPQVKIPGMVKVFCPACSPNE